MKPGGILLLAAVLVLILLGGTIFIVDETQQVVITQFGKPVGDAILKPGINWKIPFIKKSHFFEKRFLGWNGDANEVPTKDKRFLLVDTYARWRITDPLKFFQRLQNERGALSRLEHRLGIHSWRGRRGSGWLLGRPQRLIEGRGASGHAVLVYGVLEFKEEGYDPDAVRGREFRRNTGGAVRNNGDALHIVFVLSLHQ